jgi:hypothetical protein
MNRSLAWKRVEKRTRASVRTLEYEREIVDEGEHFPEIFVTLALHACNI